MFIQINLILYFSIMKKDCFNTEYDYNLVPYIVRYQQIPLWKVS